MTTIFEEQSDLVAHYLEMVLKVRLAEKASARDAYLGGSHALYEVFSKTEHSFNRVFGTYHAPESEAAPFRELIQTSPVLSALVHTLHSPIFTELELLNHNLQCADANGVPLTLGDSVCRIAEVTKPHRTLYHVVVKYGRPTIACSVLSMKLHADTCAEEGFIKVS